MSNLALPDSIISSEENLELSNTYQSLAKNSFQRNIELTKKAIQEDPEYFDGVVDGMASTSNQTASGQFSLTSAFIHTWFSSNPAVNFEDGTKLEFKGDAWGIGLGGGVIWLTGWMNDPSDLIGKVNFTLATSPLTTEVSFFKNKRPVGVLLGGGLNVQTGYFSGDGTFKRV